MIQKGVVSCETEDYHPVGVFEDGKIVFEDNLQVANHYDRVRESTIPEDTEEAYDLLKCFIEDNYTELDLPPKFYNTIQVFWTFDAGRTYLYFGANFLSKGTLCISIHNKNSIRPWEEHG